MLKPEILAQGQKVAAAKLGPVMTPSRSTSSSTWFGLAEVRDRGLAALRRGEDERRHRHPVRVQPSDRGHFFTNYDGVLKVDGEVGNKKVYDPRSYLKKAEAGMTERVIEACNDLHSAGRSVSAS
jgi:fructose-bisphosphate aldolase class II